MRRAWLPLLGLALLDACVAPRQAPPPPAPAPAPTPAPAPPPAPAPEWRDRAYSPGDWSYAAGEARFGLPGAEPQLRLRCADRQVTVELPGATPGPVTIRTSYGDTVRSNLSFGATDPLLDQIAYSRGRFMVAGGGRELILPAWPEVQRVIEDCRP